jgi:UDP-N-acetylglucosamine acyltransferase
MIDGNTFVHKNAKIGKNVTLSPFCYVDDNVEIGDNTWIGPNVSIFSGARIGKNCQIFPGAVISAVPQDLKFQGEATLAIIGDNTTIRECVTINRGTKYLNKTEIGKNCLLMAYVHVAHDCVVGNNCIIANSVNLAGHITIGDWVIIEGMAAVQQFLRIGDHSFVSGCSQVRKDIPPYVKAGREPLSYIGINSVGLQRRGFSQEKIHEIQDVYRYIFVKNLSLGNAVIQVMEAIPSSPERDHIISFINSAEKGIMKGFQSKDAN